MFFASGENIRKEEARAVLSDVLTDLRWTHFQLGPGAIATLLYWQLGKHKHLLYVGGGILSGKMQYALDTIQSVSSGLMCVCVSVCVRFQLAFAVYSCAARVCVCVNAAERQKAESLGGITWRLAGTPSDKHTSLQAYLPD